VPPTAVMIGILKNAHWNLPSAWEDACADPLGKESIRAESSALCITDLSQYAVRIRSPCGWRKNAGKRFQNSIFTGTHVCRRCSRAVSCGYSSIATIVFFFWLINKHGRSIGKICTKILLTNLGKTTKVFGIQQMPREVGVLQ
jgi:hypothetical protein